jgi:hypothetical protein
MCGNEKISIMSTKSRQMAVGVVRLLECSEGGGVAMQYERTMQVRRVRGVGGVGGGVCGVLERASVEIADEMCVEEMG